MPKDFKPPERPDRGAGVREWVSYRTRKEIYDLAEAAGMTPYEIADIIGMNQNTFRTLYHGLRNRNPTAEVLNDLHDLNTNPIFKHVPRRESDGLLINVNWIITGERHPVGDGTAGEQLKKLGELLNECEKKNRDLREAVVAYEKIIGFKNRTE